MKASKDYYAILMVHPKAETFVIEAAYKRLAREYHPDFGKARNNHEKMIEINEAYAVLSDSTRRRSFDEEYGHQLGVNVMEAHTRNVPHPPPQPKPTDPMRGNICPAPPKPATFGIDTNYLARAIEGAQAWKQREHRIPDYVKWLTRAGCGLVGITLSFMFFRSEWWRNLAFFTWFLLPLFGELSLRLIERIRDAHLLRYKFNPLYNPNPAGFQAYAQAQAQYESDTITVYVSPDAIFHAQKSCQGMSRYEPMPKWFAIFKNDKPCTRCGRFESASPKQLPPPFGR